MIDKIIGVVDLKNGEAVHAIAGRRDVYQPMAWCGGSPLRLAQHYRGIGLSRIYIADLDSILGGSVQAECLIEVVDQFDGSEILIDAGWRGDDADQRGALETIFRRRDSVRFIAATESARSVDAVRELVDFTVSDRVFLGLDIRDDALVDSIASEDQWIRTAIAADVAGIVVLDIKQVGTAGGPVTGRRCRRMKETFPSRSVYSGGGIRSTADVVSLIDAGCDACLVGTMLHQP